MSSLPARLRPPLVLATAIVLGAGATIALAAPLHSSSTLARARSAASSAHQGKRCASRSRSRPAPRNAWGATWGWGWQARTFFAKARGASSEQAKRSRRCRRSHHKAPARHGVSTTPPVGVAPGSSGSGSGSGGSTETSTPAGGTPVESGEGPAPPSVTHVQVTAVEYHFTLSRTAVPAGKVAFDFVNSGQDEHNLNFLSGEGSLSGSFPNTVSKGVRDQTIEMRHGSYTLFCSLPEHEAKGMKATLVVE
jgi:plastocyanin